MAEPLANVSDWLPPAMIQIRADLSRAGDAIAEAAGVAVPGPTRYATGGDRWLGWMSPDELLFILPADQRAAALADLGDALAGEPALVADVTDMRVGFAIDGPKAAQVLAKLCPVDFAALPADGLRRTRAAQTACALWPEGQGYRLICFRSVGDYMRTVLTNAAMPGTDLDPR
ncbi:sarcosine oxidase subunit gamma [Paracoccus pacificus]|uniref:Sarcosine oxidase subunit gamma n=1 Tax=Paracoccus pacificus TaxID=1463598 RepID=A0ABW4R7R8_9RHOB